MRNNLIYYKDLINEKIEYFLNIKTNKITQNYIKF